MTVWRWLGSLVFMAGLVLLLNGNLAVTAQDKKDETKKEGAKKDETKKDEAKKDESKKDEAKKTDAKKEEPKKEEPKQAELKPGEERLPWKAFEPKSVFFQVLDTSTTQEMTVMNQKIEQKQMQKFLLKWTADNKDAQGNYVVTQEIVGLKMNINIGGNNIAYDSTEEKEKQPQNPMTDFFKALLGQKLKLTISPKMKVENVEGQEEFVKKLGGANPQMEPLLKSILSKDALVQMAEPTWGALPDQVISKGSNWGTKTPNKLDLGPIGTYMTTFNYTYEGKDDKGRDKIAIKSELKYTKPDAKSGPTLPFQIKEANLSSKEGSGVAYFDQAKGRFAETSMKMRLEGDLTIEVGGMDTKVSLTQVQDATSKTYDEQPPEWTAKKK